jgi:hypothetical protein
MRCTSSWQLAALWAVTVHDRSCTKAVHVPKPHTFGSDTGTGAATIRATSTRASTATAAVTGTAAATARETALFHCLPPLLPMRQRLLPSRGVADEH